MNSHICHIINHLGAGGAEQYVVQVSNYLCKSGCKVSIVAGEPQTLSNRIDPGIHIETINIHPGNSRSICKYLFHIFVSCKKLINYFHSSNVTVVHTHLVASALPAWLAAKWCRIPVIHSKMHAVNVGSRFEKLLFSLRIPLLFINYVLVFTNYFRREVNERWHVPYGRIINSSIGVDVAHFVKSETLVKESRKKLGINDDFKVMLVVARLDPIKDVGLAIKAANALNDPNALLLIVGEGDEREKLERLASKLSGSTKVRFLGLLNDPRPAFWASNLLLQTSRAPNLGTVTLEAMASSLPIVIAYRDEDEYLMAIDTFEGNNIGIITEANPSALANAIASMFTRQKLMQEFGANARSFVEHRHCRDKVYCDLLEIYEAIDKNESKNKNKNKTN